MPPRPQPPARQGNLFAPGDTAGSPIEAVLALEAPQLHQWQQRLSQFQQPQFLAVARAGSAIAGGTQPGATGAGPAWAGTANPGSNASAQQHEDEQEPAETQAPGGKTAPAGGQGSLFSAAGMVPPGAMGPDPQALAAGLDPLALVAQPLQFWRWPEAPQRGAALYFVVDRPSHLASPLLLYVGETGSADRRWKGEHDCKDYLAAYGAALQQVGMGCQLSIRFWSDAPAATRQRRALEQALIRLWQPPFNKETRGRWATPFTT